LLFNPRPAGKINIIFLYIHPGQQESGMTLTPKQEAFVRAYLEGGNASAAYRAAYEVKPTTKPASVHQLASRLLARVEVRSRVEELRARQERVAQAAADITVEERVQTYTQLARLALERGDLGTAVRAQDSITRIAGLFAENRRNDRDAVAELPRELRDQLAALARAKLAGLH
jgi:hypothetical protein